MIGRLQQCIFGNSGFVVGDRAREALLKLPQRWKKQLRCAAFPNAAWKSTRQLFHSSNNADGG